LASSYADSAIDFTDDMARVQEKKKRGKSGAIELNKRGKKRKREASAEHFGLSAFATPAVFQERGGRGRKGRREGKRGGKIPRACRLCLKKKREGEKRPAALLFFSH